MVNKFNTPLVCPKFKNDEKNWDCCSCSHATPHHYWGECEGDHDKKCPECVPVEETNYKEYHRLCSISGCFKSIHSKGLCRKHYDRARRSEGAPGGK